MGCLGRLLRSIAIADGSELDAPEASRLRFITFHSTYSKEHAAILASRTKSETLHGITVKKKLLLTCMLYTQSEPWSPQLGAL